MRLKNQKRIAASVLKIGSKKVKFDPERLADIKEGITRADIRNLIIGKAIKAEHRRGISRSRARKIIIQKRKGRKSGKGSKSGPHSSRLNRKDRWVAHVRLQREFIKNLRDKKLITTKVYGMIYKKIKGGFFRSRGHLKLYLTENKLFENVTK